MLYPVTDFVYGNCGCKAQGAVNDDMRFCVILEEEGEFGADEFFYCGKSKHCNGCKAWRIFSPQDAPEEPMTASGHIADEYDALAELETVLRKLWQ